MWEDRAGETVADQVMVSGSCGRLHWGLNEAVLLMRIQDKNLMTPAQPSLVSPSLAMAFGENNFISKGRPSKICPSRKTVLPPPLHF